jgi:hypothetical protein
MPAALFEMGFISNDQDLASLWQDRNNLLKEFITITLITLSLRRNLHHKPDNFFGGIIYAGSKK